MSIYFDNAATAPAIKINEESSFGNPSSPHIIGLQAERKLGKARDVFASVLGCAENEIVFTSGGTESNNIALIGAAMANRRREICFFAEPWAHPSVLEPLRFIQEQELAEVKLTALDNLENLPDTSKINIFSLLDVNHETGDINDISKMAKNIKEKFPTAIIHVDGVQGFCKEDINIADVNMYSFSAHKVHGVDGAGGLFIRNGTKILPLMFGGGQERGLRPGTENVGGIFSFSQTVEFLKANQTKNRALVSEIYEIIKSIQDELTDVFINNRGGKASPYILNMSFLGINGETLVHLLSERGVYASMGAACKSRKKVKTSLELMGFAPERVQSAVRFSFSALNTVDEANHAKAIIIDAVNQLRRMLRR